jgi:hypothetical protein
MKPSTPATLWRGRTVTESKEEEGTGNGIPCVEVMGDMMGVGDGVERQRGSQLEEGEQIGWLSEELPPLLDQNL